MGKVFIYIFTSRFTGSRSRQEHHLLHWCKAKGRNRKFSISILSRAWSSDNWQALFVTKICKTWWWSLAGLFGCKSDFIIKIYFSFSGQVHLANCRLFFVRFFDGKWVQRYPYRWNSESNNLLFQLHFYESFILVTARNQAGHLCQKNYSQLGKNINVDKQIWH